MNLFRNGDGRDPTKDTDLVQFIKERTNWTKLQGPVHYIQQSWMNTLQGVNFFPPNQLQPIPL